MTDPEIEVLESFHKRRRTFVAGRDLVLQGQCHQAAYILMSGWALSYKIQSDGQRQIIDFRVPGDFLGLRNVLMHVADHSIEPITDIEVTKVLVVDIMNAFQKVPRLALAIFWAASRDEAMAAEHIVDLGRRKSEERVAHFMLELGARLTLIGLGNKKGFNCPLTQYLLADALGLSSVHINRVLRHLRETGLMTFKDGYVSFDNYERLAKFADFDPTYLDQVGPLMD